MLVLVVSVLILQRVHAACNVTELCPNGAALQAQITEKHNALRRTVHPPAANMLKMTWSDALAANAQAWLDKCILNHGPASSRIINDYELGENLFFAYSKYDWDTVVTAWYNEVRNYKYPKGSINGEPVGHYTQVVWNSSYQVGCGVTKCGNLYFYGCHYYRAGNYVGWPPYQVGLPCSFCPNDCEDNLCTNPCPYINKFLNCPALKKQAGCGNRWVSAWCPAACKCIDEIVPIYKK